MGLYIKDLIISRFEVCKSDLRNSREQGPGLIRVGTRFRGAVWGV